MSKREEPLVDSDKSVEKNLADIPAKSGTAGTLLVTIIVIAVLGILVLVLLLLLK